VPRAGYITIYDRSWYGRVLVERVEGFASAPEWHRAYAEINHFEEELIESGIILMKFWLHVSKDEQLRRFKEREQIAYKQHKITDEDWRNREKWDAYRLAVNEMVIRTSTEHAPWHVVEATAGGGAESLRSAQLTMCRRHPVPGSSERSITFISASQSSSPGITSISPGCRSCGLFAIPWRRR
jgi:polyphosphate kinase 2 (PPK2 family)